MKALKNLILEYFEDTFLLGLCTATIKGEPWASSVYFAFDQVLNLYFISKLSRRHSQELVDNPLVAGIICKSHAHPFRMPCRGLQLEGRILRLDDTQLASAGLELYMKRFPDSRRFHKSMADVTGNAERRVFLFKPARIVLFDEENFPECPQQEYTAEKAQYE